MFGKGITQATTTTQALQPDNVQLQCQNLCSTAASNNCRVDDLLHFCKKKFEVDYEPNTGVGLGLYDKGRFVVCEDSVYCPLEYNCNCGGELTMQRCVELARKTAEEDGIEDVDARLASLFKFTEGACSEEPPESWTALYLQ